MSGVVVIKVVVYEDEVEKTAMKIQYYEGQPYTVKIDTPDGTDRQYDAKTSRFGSTSG